VLGGAFASNTETLATLPNNPSYYTLNAINLAQFPIDLAAGEVTTPGGNGGFSQNVQRLGSMPRIRGAYRTTSPSTTACAIRPPSGFFRLPEKARPPTPASSCCHRWDTRSSSA